VGATYDGSNVHPLGVTMKLSRAVAAAAASALLTMTACGSSESLATDGGSASSDPQTNEPADDVTTEGEPTAGELDEESFLSTVADAQLAASTTRMDMSMDLSGQSVTVTGQLEGADTVKASAMELEMEIPGLGSLELILVDGILYLNAGAATGNKFAELRLDDPAAEQYLGQLQGQLNPVAMTKALQGALTGFEAVGADPVNGHDATKFILEVVTAKVRAAGGVAEVPGFELPETMVYTFWLDDEQLPVRTAIDMGELGVVEMNFSDWGEPVDIQPPPRSQIMKQNPFSAPQA
jgi:hypothetical protein